MEINKAKIFFIFFLTVFLMPSARAHCPLCTMGAAAAAGGALWLGVNAIVIGLFIGAFAVSTGWWVSNMLKKQYIPRQQPILIIISFLLTILPIVPVITENNIMPLYISWFGDYGSLFNRTYLLNSFLFGSIVGGSIVSITPWISRGITTKRGRTLPFQGVMLTLILLMVTAVTLQYVM